MHLCLHRIHMNTHCFGGLRPPNNAPSPPKSKHETLWISGVFVKFWNVKPPAQIQSPSTETQYPPYWKLSGDGYDNIPISITGSGLSTSTSTCTTLLPIGFIHQHNLVTDELRVSMHQTEQTVLPQCRSIRPFAQLLSVRAVMLAPRDANNIQGMSFGFYTCDWNDIPVAITSSWHDCSLRLVINSK